MYIKKTMCCGVFRNIVLLETPDKKTLVLDKSQALAKAEHYCAYQERAQQEIRDKLYEWGLRTNDVEEIITELILTNFLNEERFAMAYVSGKFSIKRWGKHKIKQGLKLKKVPDKMITRALNSINFDDYLKVILLSAEKKSKLLNEKDPFKKKHKLISYLLGKGFENDLILSILKDNNLP